MSGSREPNTYSSMSCFIMERQKRIGILWPFYIRLKRSSGSVPLMRSKYKTLHHKSPTSQTIIYHQSSSEMWNQVLLPQRSRLRWSSAGFWKRLQCITDGILVVWRFNWVHWLILVKGITLYTGGIVHKYQMDGKVLQLPWKERFSMAMDKSMITDNV